MNNHNRNTQPVIATSSFIHPSAVVVGDVTVDEDASLWPQVTARGDMHFIRIGKRSNIQDGSVLHVNRAYAQNPEGSPLIIGDDVTVGHLALLHGCRIGNRVLVGMGSIVLDDAILEDEVLLGAGSLVPPKKVLKSGYLYLGNPARAVRELTAAERAFFVESAQNYCALAQQFKENVYQHY